KDEQPPIRPTSPLNEEGAEVGRRGAEREALWVVVEFPDVGNQIDGGFGVLDDRSILDEFSDWVAVLGRLSRDVLERPFPRDRVRPDPVRCAVVREPLINDVLHVGGGAGHPLEKTRRRGERTVWRLNHRDSLVPALSHHADEPESIL